MHALRKEKENIYTSFFIYDFLAWTRHSINLKGKQKRPFLFFFHSPSFDNKMSQQDFFPSFYFHTLYTKEETWTRLNFLRFNYFEANTTRKCGIISSFWQEVERDCGDVSEDFRRFFTHQEIKRHGNTKWLHHMCFSVFPAPSWRAATLGPLIRTWRSLAIQRYSFLDLNVTKEDECAMLKRKISSWQSRIFRVLLGMPVTLFANFHVKLKPSSDLEFHWKTLKWIN